jgi:hypothetical protein
VARKDRDLPSHKLILLPGSGQQEKMFAVMMVRMLFPQLGPCRRAMRELVYGALVR